MTRTNLIQCEHFTIICHVWLWSYQGRVRAGSTFSSGIFLLSPPPTQLKVSSWKQGIFLIPLRWRATSKNLCAARFGQRSPGCKRKNATLYIFCAQCARKPIWLTYLCRKKNWKAVSEAVSDVMFLVCMFSLRGGQFLSLVGSNGFGFGKIKIQLGEPQVRNYTWENQKWRSGLKVFTKKIVFDNTPPPPFRGLSNTLQNLANIQNPWSLFRVISIHYTFTINFGGPIGPRGFDMVLLHSPWPNSRWLFTWN